MAEKNRQLLDAIKQQILDENVCPELAAEATQLVFADGSPTAEVVLIGEAPGKNEDEQGLPFVGAAGKFLNEMLATINMDRNDIYITNIVKYRPPNNRDPLPEEKKAFWPFLVSQLNVIKPKLVVTLGRHSMEYFLPNMKISQIHGEPKRLSLRLAERRTKNEERRENPKSSVSSPQSSVDENEQAITSLVILPLYHPAAALYNGGMRQTLIDDFSRIPTILKKITK